METNLASKDSHWVYANEVRPDTNSHKHRGKLFFFFFSLDFESSICFSSVFFLFLFIYLFLHLGAFIQCLITGLMGLVHLFLTLTSSDPLAGHFLLLVVDINSVTHSNLIFL